MLTIAADVAGRRAACTANPSVIPSGDARSQDNGISFRADFRAQLVEHDGKNFHELTGYASTVEQPYEMYDMFGPYTEVIDRGAFDKTLAAAPDVSFLVNHRGLSMARTKSGTLTLSADDTGLLSRSLLNPERTDVRDLVLAIEDRTIDEMSFAFRIVRGQWSPDYMEYRILEVNLERGDVSAVNYGANPFTSISARAKSAIAAVEDLPMPILRALVARGEERLLGVGDNTADTTIVEDTPDGMSYAEAALMLELQS
jgi:HK97 family phage prohead protease